MSQAGVHAAAATVSAEASSSNLSSLPLQIDFDNDGDPDVTLVSVSGPDQRDLLMQLTGAFNSMQLLVVAASIVTTEEGRVRDVFKVTDQRQQKVHAPAREQHHLRRLCFDTPNLPTSLICNGSQAITCPDNDAIFVHIFLVAAVPQLCWEQIPLNVVLHRADT